MWLLVELSKVVTNEPTPKLVIIALVPRRQRCSKRQNIVINDHKKTGISLRMQVDRSRW